MKYAVMVLYKVLHDIARPPLMSYINRKTNRVTRGSIRGDCTTPLQKKCLSAVGLVCQKLRRVETITNHFHTTKQLKQRMINWGLMSNRSVAEHC